MLIQAVGRAQGDRYSVLYPSCGSGNERVELCLGRVVVPKPFLNFFFLSGKHDALPFHYSRALTVLGHDVGTLVEHLDQAVCFCPFEPEGRKRGMVFLHLLYRIADPPAFYRKYPNAALKRAILTMYR